MSDTGTQRNLEKTALEVEKLALEKRLLQRQLSRQGLLMAWLQSAAVPAALVGASVAFFVGFSQLQQGAHNQAADRFDKALTRLASTRPDERMTGISGLEFTLGDRNNPLLQKQALRFLINGLSLETDTRVRGAILDVLADLEPGQPSQAVLDEGLRTAVERNRSLTRAITDNWPRRVSQQKKETLAKFKVAGLDVGAMGDEIPVRVLASLKTEQYLALLDAEHGPFERLTPTEEVPLIGLRTAIGTLLARGATSRDFKAIYCEGCDFQKAKALDEAVFDGAYLTGADFSHVSLRGASLRNADIGGASFFGADLSKADLRLDQLKRGFASKVLRSQLPLLECAKLGGADLSGQPLVLFEKDFDTTSSSGLTYSILLPQMISVAVDGSTRLDSFRILIAIGVTDDYLKQHPAAPEIKVLTTERESGWDNPLVAGSWFSPGFRRIQGHFAQDAAKYATTTAMLDWEVEADELGRLGKDAFMLRGFVDQPALKALPLYARFVEAVNALSVPRGPVAKAAQGRSDKAAKTWAATKPPSCSEPPRGREFLFDLGSYASTYAGD